MHPPPIVRAEELLVENPEALLASLEAEVARRELARRHLLDFAIYNIPGYVAALPHRIISEKLEAFFAGRIKKLMIFIPPQHGKSQLSSKLFPAYALGRNPNLKIVTASFSLDLASDFNRSFQRIVDSPTYRQLFPNTVLAGTPEARLLALERELSTAQTYLRNTAAVEIVGYEGSYRTVGVGKPLTGKPMDIGIIDDPVKDRAEAESKVVRKRVREWYDDVFTQRLHNDSQQLILMTRWHPEDLAGQLEAEDNARAKRGEPREWEIVRVPAIKVGPPTELDPRQPGEALWPEKHSAAKHFAVRATSERTYSALLQQEPVPSTGNIIRVGKIGRITGADLLAKARGRNLVWNFIIDGAYTNREDRDATALFAYCELDGILYIRASESVRLEMPELLKYIPVFCVRHGYSPLSRVRIEPKANGLSVYQMLKSTTRLNVMPYEFPLTDTGSRLDDKDKEVRADAASPFIDSGRVCLVIANWNDSFIYQCTIFPHGTHDDEVDCLVMAVLPYQYPEAVVEVSSSEE